MPRLLLVDDNPSIQKIVVSLLDSTHIEILYATSAAEAIGCIAKEEPFDIVLIDTTLPEVDGWWLLDRLRTNPATSNWRIAMMAGVLEEVDPALIKNAPIQAFIRKPVDFRDLSDKINELLAIPLETSRPSGQQGDETPSDLLILGEQDLAEETEKITAAPTEMPTEHQEPGIAIDSSTVTECAIGSEEVISLELEDLNFSDMEQLALAESISPDGSSTECLAETPIELESPIESPAKTPVEGTGESIVPEENPQQESTEYLDASPEDFDQDMFPIEFRASLSSGQRQDLSAIASELISNPRFIDEVARAVAKAVAKKLMQEKR